jgi:hypothetical protein
MSSISGASSASNPYLYLSQNGLGAKKTARNQDQAQGTSVPPTATPPAAAASTSPVDSDGDHDGSSFSVKA